MKIHLAYYRKIICVVSIIPLSGIWYLSLMVHDEVLLSNIGFGKMSEVFGFLMTLKTYFQVIIITVISSVFQIICKVVSDCSLLSQK